MEIEIDITEELTEIANKLKNNIMKKLKQLGVSDKIRESVDVKVVNDGICIEMGEPIIILEYGMVNGMLYIDSLTKWAMKKFNVSEKEAVNIAKVINNELMKIASNPRPIIRSSIYEVIDK